MIEMDDLILYLYKIFATKIESDRENVIKFEITRA